MHPHIRLTLVILACAKLAEVLLVQKIERVSDTQDPSNHKGSQASSSWLRRLRTRTRLGRKNCAQGCYGGVY